MQLDTPSANANSKLATTYAHPCSFSFFVALWGMKERQAVAKHALVWTNTRLKRFHVLTSGIHRSAAFS
jgi:hypothetical protein